MVPFVGQLNPAALASGADRARTPPTRRGSANHSSTLPVPAAALDAAASGIRPCQAGACGDRPAPDFYQFIEVMALEGARNRAIGDALAGAGFDVQAAAAGADQDLVGMWSTLLTSAQAAGQVRADVTADDVKALVVGVCANRSGPDPGHAATRCVLSVITAGLQPAVSP